MFLVLGLFAIAVGTVIACFAMSSPEIRWSAWTIAGPALFFGVFFCGNSIYTMLGGWKRFSICIVQGELIVEGSKLRVPVAAIVAVDTDSDGILIVEKRPFGTISHRIMHYYFPSCKDRDDVAETIRRRSLELRQLATVKP